MSDTTETNNPKASARFWPASPETKDVDMPTPEQARQTLLLLALPGGFEDLVKLAGGFEKGVGLAFQAVATELLRHYHQIEEHSSGLHGLGAMVGGLFGIDTEPDESDEPEMRDLKRDLNGVGSDLRERIIAKAGQ